jgi:hypothetical protein
MVCSSLGRWEASGEALSSVVFVIVAGMFAPNTKTEAAQWPPRSNA